MYCYLFNSQALLFLLAVIVTAVNRPADYDSDEEFINHRQSVKQPLISRQAPATVVPVVTALDQRPPGRNDAWSARMREKVQLMHIFSTLRNNFHENSK